MNDDTKRSREGATGAPETRQTKRSARPSDGRQGRTAFGRTVISAGEFGWPSTIAARFSPTADFGCKGLVADLRRVAHRQIGRPDRYNFIAREPAQANRYTKAGFDAFWKAVAG
jgi:hypothetical protein